MRFRQRSRLRTIGNLLFIILLVALALRNSGLIGNVSGRYAIVDGDSLEYKKQRIRLKGIDAPELNQTCSDRSGAEYKCGREAKQALQDLIGSGEISCAGITTDRYQRKLAYCARDDLDINKEMVRQGWAVAYERHVSSYLFAQAEAKKARRGLWAGTFEAPEDYRKRHRRAESNLGESSEDDD